MLLRMTTTSCPAPVPGIGDAVHHRVLDQRLQQQLRDQHRANVGGDLPAHRETPAEAHLLELQVGLHEGEFFAERDKIRGAVLEHLA